jgi:DHA1 family bicyclomycin/chloramphenicol resistance-like MFS transporter
MTAPRQVSLEFIVLVALLNAMVAMSIDTMLPAIGQIAADLGATRANDRQLIITLFFGGMMVGTLIYGPLSDVIGRKPAIFAGLALYALGALLCLVSGSFNMILAGRVLQGFGASGPRTVSIAMVRDGNSGAAMARVMSFVMSVFMLVPIMAPSVGQAVLLVASWRVIFAGFLVMALIAGTWLFYRQPETLPAERRKRLAVMVLVRDASTFVRHPVSLGYTLAVGCIFGAFICYLSISQQVFAEQYRQGAYFAVWFALFAVAIAIAMILNGRLVVRLGMRGLSKWALRLAIAGAILFLILAYAFDGHPPLWLLGLWLFATFFCCGILFANYNALALEPMGEIAGVAAALSSAISTLVAILAGSWFGQHYDGTVYPLVAAYGGLGIVAFLLSETAELLRR